MSLPTRRCPFHGCTKAIPPEFFACSRHWKQIPKPDQDAIYECYRLWESGQIDGPELRRRQQVVLDRTVIGGVA